MNRWTSLLGIELSPVSWKEKWIACLGGFVSISFLVFFCEQCLQQPHALALVASMGASAVLLFAVPHGQLSQPWPVLLGHGLSAVIGVICAKWIPHTGAAAACSVGFAILAMQVFKCVHPPGGATALTAVMGSQAIHESGFSYILFPVLLNATVMVAIAILFNFAFKWRRYPAALVKTPTLAPAQAKDEPSHEEIVAALKSLDSFVDITEADLLRLLHILEKRPHT